MRQNQATDTHVQVCLSHCHIHTLQKVTKIFPQKEKTETRLLSLQFRLKNFLQCAQTTNTRTATPSTYGKTHTRCVCSYTWTSAVRLAPDFALCRHKQQLKLLNSLLSVGIIQAGRLQRTDVGEEGEEEEDRRKMKR